MSSSDIIQHGLSGYTQLPYGSFAGKEEQPEDLTSPLFDGANSYLINSDYGSVQFYFNGTDYFSI